MAADEKIDQSETRNGRDEGRRAGKGEGLKKKQWGIVRAEIT